jgi:hypothetical protein
MAKRVLGLRALLRARGLIDNQQPLPRAAMLKGQQQIRQLRQDG